LLSKGLSFAEPHAASLQWLYEHLDEDESRQLLVSIIAYRALGMPCKAAVQPDRTLAKGRGAGEQGRGAESIDPNFLGWRLSKLDMARGWAFRSRCIAAGGCLIQCITSSTGA